MNTQTSTRTRLFLIPVLVALVLNVLIPLTPAAISRVSAADGIDDYSQCQIGNPNAGLDCESWINGILNATHNNYSEDEVVPQRLVMDFDDTGIHTVTLSYMTRKDSSGANHAYDYLATWNHTYVNADRCQDLQAANCVGGAADLFPIPSDPANVSPGGPQPTSLHELPQANRQFVMYGGDMTATSAITHSVDPLEAGSDYGNITITFDVTDADGKVMLLFGGHLASGFGPRGWGAGLGAADISGGPYHIRVTAMDGASAGNRDNQIMSDAIQPLLPALTITKTPDGGSVNAGDYASFTITVTNNGPGAATNVDIDDDLPEGPGATNTGLVWSEFPDVPECGIVSNNLHCDIASLADDASFSVTVRALTDSGDCGTLNNTAFADADNNTPVSDTGSVNVICPALSITKTPDGEIVNAGEEIDFTITVTNNGPGVATNVDIDDHLPAGFTWSEDPDKTECTIVAHLDHQDLHCDIASLGDDASFSVTVSAPTDKDDCSTTAYFNTARADADNHAEVTNTGDITIQCPNLSITKTPDGEIVNAGEEIDFTITVTNNGPGVATNVDIDDHLPAGFTWSEDPDKTECTIVAHLDHQDLHCDIASLGDDASFSVTVSAPTDKDDCSTTAYFNTARADADNHAEVTNTGDITIQCPNLSITKTPDGEIVNAGEEIDFTITVTNNGPGVATNVDIDDHLPAGFTWSEDPDKTECTIVAHLDHQDLHCDIASLGDDASFSVTVSAPTDKDDCSTTAYFNTARADADNHAEVTNTGDITIQCPDAAVVKEAVNAVIDAGTNASFTIVVSADGDSDSENVVLTDENPADSGRTWTVSGANSAACTSLSIAPGETLTCNFGTIPEGQSRTVTITTTSSTEDCSDAIENTASITSTADVNSSNNQDSDSIVVECPGLNLLKSATTGEVVAGQVARFEIRVWNTGPGDALGAFADDDLPAGLNWNVQLQSPDADDSCQVASSTTPGGATQMSFHCSFGTLPVTTMAGGKLIVVTATTDNTDCGVLNNTATADASNHGAPLTSSASITVRCPTLVIDKVASIETITISGPNNALVATPSVVTWTLSYTLANGPVTNAVITDPVPTGFTFLDAANGGTFANGIITWNLGTLTSSGSVTFRTTVNPATISRTGPTVNTATIDSTETPPDDGQDSVTVTVVPPPLGGTPTPRPPLPNTATGIGIGGVPVTVPVELLVVFFIGSLGALALANVRASSSRRR